MRDEYKLQNARAALTDYQRGQIGEGELVERLEKALRDPPPLTDTQKLVRIRAALLANRVERQDLLDIIDPPPEPEPELTPEEWAAALLEFLLSRDWTNVSPTSAQPPTAYRIDFEKPERSRNWGPEDKWNLISEHALAASLREPPEPPEPKDTTDGRVPR